MHFESLGAGRCACLYIRCCARICTCVYVCPHTRPHKRTCALSTSQAGLIEATTSRRAEQHDGDAPCDSDVLRAHVVRLNLKRRTFN